MKKITIKHTGLALLLAGAGLGTAAVPGMAAAQSAVTIYGLLDEALVLEKGGAAGSSTKVTSGVTGGSRIGFKGSEDLGNGLSAVFLLESGINLDTGTSGQGGILFGRQIYAGLVGNFGSVLLGRQYTPEYMTLVLADPFSTGWAGDAKNLSPTTGNAASRMDNTVKYLSPKFNGVSAELAYGAGEVSGDNASGRQIGAALAYAGGPLNVRLGYHNRNNDTALLKNTSNGKNLLLAATYDFGVFKGHASYGTARGLNSSPLRNATNPFGRTVTPVASTDSSNLLLGATVPFGGNALLLSYTRKDDKTALNQDASQWAIGYSYALSKRTDLYTGYAKINNRNGASYTVGSSIESGSGDAAYNFGIRHRF
jgi:predicted porin